MRRTTARRTRRRLRRRPVSILKPLCGLDDGLRAEPRVLLPARLSASTRSSSPSRADTRPGLSDRPAGGRPPSVGPEHVRLRRARAGRQRQGQPPGGGAWRARGTAWSSSPTATSACGRTFCARAVSHFARSARGPRVAPLPRDAARSASASRVESLYLNGCLQPGTAALAGRAPDALRRRQVDPGFARGARRDRRIPVPRELSGRGLPARPAGARAPATASCSRPT